METFTLNGRHLWTKRNLDVDFFLNGDKIPQCQSTVEWVSANLEKRAAWCYYSNDPEKGKMFGKLYNWYAVSDPRGLAPLGFKIPSYQEAKLLLRDAGVIFDEYDDYNLSAQDQMKFLLAGSNDIGFSAVMTGKRTPEGDFEGMDIGAAW